VVIRTIAVIPAWLLEAAATAVTDRMSLACTATRFAGSAVTNVRFGSLADIRSAKEHVRFATESDQVCDFEVTNSLPAQCAGVFISAVYRMGKKAKCNS